MVREQMSSLVGASQSARTLDERISKFWLTMWLLVEETQPTYSELLLATSLMPMWVQVGANWQCWLLYLKGAKHGEK